MKDLGRLAEHKHFHNRVVQRDGDIAFIAGSPTLVDELADHALTLPAAVEVNRDQLNLLRHEDAA